MNKSAQFLNHGYIYQDRPITKAQLDHIRDEAKRHERANRVRTDHLTKEQHKKAVFITTIISHLSEFMVDCLDEIIAMGIIGKEHDFHQINAKCIHLSTHFLNHAVEQGEEKFMERQAQQIKFENLFKNIVNMNIDQLHALFNFAENIKHKK